MVRELRWEGSSWNAPMPEDHYRRDPNLPSGHAQWRLGSCDRSLYDACVAKAVAKAWTALQRRDSPRLPSPRSYITFREGTLHLEKPPISFSSYPLLLIYLFLASTIDSSTDMLRYTIVPPLLSLQYVWVTLEKCITSNRNTNITSLEKTTLFLIIRGHDWTTQGTSRKNPRG
jgi:hypothetical protein